MTVWRTIHIRRPKVAGARSWRSHEVGAAAASHGLVALRVSLITCDHGDMASEPHVTLSGDIVGEYIVKDRRPNGELTLVPDTYPAVMPEYDGRPATAEEFAAFEAEHGPFLPADGEG